MSPCLVMTLQADTKPRRCRDEGKGHFASEKAHCFFLTLCALKAKPAIYRPLTNHKSFFTKYHRNLPVSFNTNALILLSEDLET